MRILIISGGSIDTTFALDFLKKNKYDRIIAVDKGAAFCYENNIFPDLLTGDFDTLSAEILQKWEEKGVPVRRFRPEKDDTDIEIALREAREILESQKGKNEKSLITVLGGTGTRLDHMLGTLYSMAGLGPDYPCELVDAHNRVRLLWPGIHTIRRDECAGRFVSFLPIGSEAEGVTLVGFKYLLNEHTMTCLNSLGVSNELEAEEGTVSFQDGILACIETKD